MVVEPALGVSERSIQLIMSYVRRGDGGIGRSNSKLAAHCECESPVIWVLNLFRSSYTHTLEGFTSC